MEIILFVLGMFFASLWFTVLVLPLLYGVPRASIWALRGHVNWRGPGKYILIWIKWFIGMNLVMAPIVIFFPAVRETLYSSAGFFYGQNLTVLFLILRALFSHSGRNDLNEDFIQLMKPYMTDEGIKAANTITSKR